jgi:hypothetical protein
VRIVLSAQEGQYGGGVLKHAQNAGQGITTTPPMMIIAAQGRRALHGVGEPHHLLVAQKACGKT